MRNLMILAALLTLGCGDKEDDTATEADADADSDTDADADADTDADTDADADADVGRTGLEGYCDRYKECGGTYYATADDCVEATLSYWGDCPEMQSALDSFGDCMMGIDCDDYNPDSYNPASTECSNEWDGVYDADC